MPRVQGNAALAKPLIVGKDTVYVHSNIVSIEDDLYEYDEEQYPKDEFIEKLGAELATTKDKLANSEDTIAELVMMQYV